MKITQKFDLELVISDLEVVRRDLQKCRTVSSLVFLTDVSTRRRETAVASTLGVYVLNSDFPSPDIH